MIFRLIVVALMCVAHISFGQTGEPYDYLYASPNAAELGKYGLVPVGLSTGTMSSSVPLYTLSAGNLSVPISMTYSSNGVRVDQVSSQVGMNWSLNAGGVITRIVRDKPDQDVFGEGMLPYPSDITTMNYQLAHYLDAAEESSFDSERDLFSFNFLGNTGKLIFDYTGEPLFMPYRNMKVNYMVDVNGGTLDFVLTDERGIRYFFEAGETSRTLADGPLCGKNFETLQETGWYLTRIIHPQGDEVVFEYDWHNFTYSTGVSQSSTGLISVISGGCSATSTPCASIDDKVCQTVVYTNTARLKRILTNGHGDVYFHYSKGRSDVYNEYKLDSVEYKLPDATVLNKWKLGYVFSTNNGYGNPLVTGDGLNSRMFLSTLTKSGDGGQEIHYGFEYEDIHGLPKRLSFSQDHWGYFNGKANTHLFPANGILAPRNDANQILFAGKGGNREPDPFFAKKGLLKKITYPTGGFTAIEYEANTFWGPQTTFPQLFNYQEVVDSQTLGGPGTVKKDTLYSGITHDAELNFTVNYLENAFEEPIHSFGRISIRNIETGIYLVENFQVAPGDSYVRKYQFEEGKHYEVTMRTFGLGVRSVTNILHYDQAPVTTNSNNITGGMRVARVVNHDPITARQDTTRYYYTFASDLTRSSGVVSSPGTYYEYSTSQIPCSINVGTSIVCVPAPCHYVSVSSSSNLNLNAFSGNNVAYGSVLTSQGNSFLNGFEEHQFMVEQNLAGQIIHGDPRIGIPQSMDSWRNGLTKSITKFKKLNDEFVQTHRINNVYEKDTRITRSVPSMVVKSKYDDEVCLVTPATALCSECQTTAQLRIAICSTNHIHNYSWRKQDGDNCGVKTTGYKCSKSDAAYSYYTVFNPCYGLSPGDSVFVESAIANLDAIEYRDHAHWYYLSKVTETTFTNGGDSLVVERNQIYANDKHLQLTGERSSTSTGDHHSTYYWYAEDYSDLPMTDSLLARNIISVPIKKQYHRNQKTIGGDVVMYNPNGTISEVWKYRKENPTDSIPHQDDTLLPSYFEKEGAITHDSGKPREVHYPDGKVATLIWAYGKNYLIAQVLNKTAAEVSAVSGFDLELLEQSSDNGYINNKMQLVRDAFPDALVTTYNYRPGVGLISVIDPNNIPIYYEYDEFGRLKWIKDDSGNIQESFSYNFKQ